MAALEPRAAELLNDLWADLHQPEVLWQLGALAICLALAWWAARIFGRAIAGATDDGSGRMWEVGRGGLKRLAFPLVALVLVLSARYLLRPWHHVNLLSLAVPLLESLALVRMVAYALRQAFAPSGVLVSLERVMAVVIWSVMALDIVGILPDVIEALESVGFSVGKQRLNLWLILQGVVMVAISLLLAMWLSNVLERRLERAADLDTSFRLVLVRLIKAVAILVAVMIALPAVGIDLTTLSVFGGALGVGLGFGLQKIASNYVSGFIILLDRSIRIGNLITVDQNRGEVTQITTRYTVLKSLTGVESLVPNEFLVSQVVKNETYTNSRVRIALPFQVAYQADLELAMKLLVDVAAAHPRVMADPAPGAFVLALADSGINLELGFWIPDPQEGTQGVRSDINLAVLKAYQAAGIEIPYPQREVRLVKEAAGV